MSVIGIDLGTATTTVAIAEGQGGARSGGVSIVLNESSGRFTPALVCFNEGKRFLGALAAPLKKSKYKNTVAQVKRLIGRKWSEPAVQAELKRQFFRSQQLDGDEIGLVLDMEGEDKVFTPTQILAMLLGNIKDYAAAYSGTPAGDVVLSVPAYFTDRQRHAMVDAARITNMKVLRLFNDTTATALSYGIYKQGKMAATEEKPEHVMFIDIGYADTTVCVVAFRPGKMDVKGTAWDRDLGGRNWDELIAKQLNSEFMSKHKGIDLQTKGKSWIKLLEAAEKAKKTLSPQGVTSARIRLECLYQDYDFSSIVQREMMEKLAEPLVARLEKPITDALAQAGVKVEDLAAIESVGGGIRVRAVQQAIEQLIKRPLSHTLNQDECCARGCALQCAMLSPKFRVKEYVVNDSIPYPVRLSWEQTDSDKADENSVLIFNHGDAFPKYRRLTFKRNASFDVTAEYDQPQLLPEGVKSRLATFNVDLDSAKPDLSEGAVQVRVFVSHDINGIFGVSTAEYMQKKPEEPAPEPEEAKPAEAADAAAEGKEEASGKEGEDKAEAKKEGEAAKEEASGKEGEGKAEAKKEGEKKEGEAAAEKEAPKKKKDRYLKIALNVSCSTTALTAEKLQQFKQAEASMQQQDRLIRERDEKRNDLEQYVYSMRDKLTEEEDFARFMADDAKTAFLAQLDEMEEWLYGDEGFDSSKSTFVKKLAGLQAIGGKVTQREFEFNNRAAAMQELTVAAQGYLDKVNGSDALYEHLSAEERQKVRDDCAAAKKEMEAKIAALEGAPLWEDPAVTVADLKARATALHSSCRPVVNKPKPAPKPVPKKEEEKKEKEEKKEGEAEGATNGAKDEGKADEARAPAAAESADKAAEDAENMKVD